MENPVKVLQLFTVLNRGGAETNVMNYYRKLDQSKVQFDFVVHREEKGAYEDEIIQLGGKIFRFLPITPFTLSKYKQQVATFFDQHKKYSIIHGQCSELGYFFYKEAHKRKIPIIIAHGHNSKVKFDVKYTFRFILKKAMMKYVNTYFSCGYDAAIWLFGKEKGQSAFIMNNAIDASEFSYNTQKDISIRKTLQAENTINIIHIGRFNLQKNHTFLIDVFKEIINSNNNYKLFLVGEGELKEDIQNKVKNLNIQDKVNFLGLRADVNELLQGMNIFLFPSLFEGLPVSFIEAQASGVKCFISETIPAEATIIPQNVQAISLNKSAKYWAEQILANKNANKENLEKEIIEAGYDINKNVRTLEQKYLSLLENR